MKVFHTDGFALPLPPGHRFPMEKYALLRQRVEAELVGRTPVELCLPPAATDAQLHLAHCAQYVARVREGRLDADDVRRLGFPWTPALVERSLRACGATIEACRQACIDGVAVNLAGGTHHAFRDRPEGYCVFNDAAVAARWALTEGMARQVVIVDCDVHQGNGTADILAHDPRVFTFSMHGAKNFPFHKAQSDLDVHLPDGTSDAPYLEALEASLDEIGRRCPQADLAIYLAGADPYEDDRLGRLRLTRNGLAQRDARVLETLRRRGIAVAIAMAGGYARTIEDTVAIHFATVQTALGWACTRLSTGGTTT